MGDCYRKLDRKSAAVDALEKAVFLYRANYHKGDDRCENPRDALYAAIVAGNVSLQLGNLGKADSLYKSAHDIFLNSSSMSSNEGTRANLSWTRKMLCVGCVEISHAWRNVEVRTMCEGEYRAWRESAVGVIHDAGAFIVRVR